MISPLFYMRDESWAFARQRLQRLHQLVPFVQHSSLVSDLPSGYFELSQQLAERVAHDRDQLRAINSELAEMKREYEALVW